MYLYNTFQAIQSTNMGGSDSKKNNTQMTTQYM